MKGSGELRAFIDGFLGSVPGAFIVLDKEWRLVYLNGDALRFFTVDDESLLGRPLEEVYPRQFGHMLAPRTIRGLLEGNENTITRYVNQFRKWYKISAYSSDSGVFIRLEDVTMEKAANRLRIMNQFSVDRAGDMIFWFKPSGHIVYANEASSKSLKFERKELVSMMVADIDPSFTDNKWASFVEDLRTRESMVYESSLLASDRSIVLVEVTCSYMVYYGDEYLIATARDITERKRAEEALRLGAERLRLALDAAKAGTWEWDLATGENVWSEECWSLYGLKPHSCKPSYDAWRGIIHPDDRERIERATNEAASRGAEHNMELRVIDIDGRIHWLNSIGRPVRDAGGKVIRYIGIVMDITERKRAEEALRESEARFKAYMDNSSATAWMKDVQGRYVYINKTYQYEIGVRPEDRLGKTDFDIWPKEIAEESRKSDLAVIVSGRPAYVIEKVPELDGSISYWYDVKFPFKDASGSMFVGGIGVDITRQKQAEEALKDAKARNELYLDLMGHDINNINQVAMGYLEIASEFLSNGGKEPVLNALDALKNSSILIENVQKLKKLQSGGLRYEAIDLNDVLLELKDQYQGSVDKDVKINYKQNPGCRVLANGLLRDVFSNLVGNAIKHTPGDNVVIDIELNRFKQDDKKYYEVSVEDNGPGIPDEMKLRIFNRLERGSTKARGKGLGLYLVKTLVDDFHGMVWVTDRVKGDSSKGSKFVVVLPALDDEAGTITSDLPHIGIAEDDGTLLNLYKMILSRNGMQVDHMAMNGLEAVDMVKNASPRPDVIILDHRMPGMTGLEAMKEILKIAPHVKIIFISADMRIKEEVLGSGASIFLHKPVKPKDIVQAVNDVLKTDEHGHDAG